MSIKISLQGVPKWGSNFENDAKRFEKENWEEGQIVFYGPSHFTRWNEKYAGIPMREALKGKSGKECVINRGFGSSCCEHQLYYYPKFVRPLKPSALVYAPLYPNGRSFGYTVEEDLMLAERVIAYAKADFPEMRLYIFGDNLFKRTQECFAEHNEGLQKLAELYGATFLDISDYKPFQRTDIYWKDNKHYNALGYQIYKDFFSEKIKEELDRF